VEMAAQFCVGPTPRHELCLFGGKCNNVTLKCDCPPGFGADWVFTHQDDCGLSSDFLFWFMLFYTILDAIIVGFMIFYIKFAIRWRWLLVNQIILGCTCFLGVIGLYVQNGMFEISIVSINLGVSVLYYLGISFF
jgi:hypothetical protein